MNWHQIRRAVAPVDLDDLRAGRADLVFLTDVALVVDLGDGAGSYRMALQSLRF